MIPGKKYTPDEIVAIVWRWKWLLVLPCLAGLIGAHSYARTLRDLYRSEATIVMTPQRVREDLVRSSIRTNLGERIQTISQQVLSRTRLESIIVDLNLYQAERRSGVMEDAVERMRRDVSVGTLRNDAFKVGYSSESPLLAMKVAERLAGLFIDENLRDREQLAQGTSQFLESQLEEARKRLVEQERRLEAYRRANAGQLPSQVESNLAAINSAQQQVQRLQDAIARDRDQLQLIERQIADANAPGALSEPVVSAEGSTGGTSTQQLEAAQNALRNLELRLKPEHPDVARTKRLIATLTKKVEAEMLEAPLTQADDAARPKTPAEIARVNRLNELEATAQRLREAVTANDAEQERLKVVIAGYQKRLDAAPTRETELIELTRNYDAFARTYNSLLAKSEESKLSMSIEARQVGEQFTLLEPARLPTRPYSPNRNRLYGIGAFGGAGLGAALIFVLVYRDSSLKTDDDVTLSLGLPVLALVPLMQTLQDRRRQRRRRVLLSGVTALLLASVGGVAWWIVTRT